MTDEENEKLNETPSEEMEGNQPESAASTEDGPDGVAPVQTGTEDQSSTFQAPADEEQAQEPADSTE